MGKSAKKHPPAKPVASAETGRLKRTLIDYGKSILVALVLALLIRATLVQAYVIPSGSMIPTLEIGDRVLVNRLAYQLRFPFTNWSLIKLGEVERGDVVVFDHPVDHIDYIKRVIGLPGDEIEIRDKVVLVNGRALGEPYVRLNDGRLLPRQRDPRDNFGPVRVPAGKLFMLGDNRDNSLDSRYWGFADASAVAGRAVVIYFSWDDQAFRPRWGRLGSMVH